MTTVTLTGISGRTYLFTIYDANVSWNQVPGLYAFADPNGNPKYIGETVDFHSRNPGPSHQKWAEAQSYGAQIILAYVEQGGEAVRKAAEADLIRAYNPPANVQQRTGATALTGR